MRLWALLAWFVVRVAASNDTAWGNTTAMAKDRFNYASCDCAAKVIRANDGAKGLSAVLQENKDSYLVNKCATEDKFIVIELCQDILIDYIEMGNFEFFSSNFEKFKVSVNERNDDTNWKVLGEFSAANSRELQSFRVANPVVWAKYVKIDFLTHYGNEFYCPVSILRVHGKTMIEEFKEEISSKSEGASVDEMECKVPSPYLGLDDFLGNLTDFCADNQTTTSVTSEPDSVYKNIIRRLNSLENNSSLSLLYIEEQSRLLSKSFTNLETRLSNNIQSMIASFNNSFDYNLVRLNQLQKTKIVESNNVIITLSSDLKFYKKLILLNLFLILLLSLYLLLIKELTIYEDADSAKAPPKSMTAIKVGSIKKKYRRRYRR